MNALTELASDCVEDRREFVGVRQANQQRRLDAALVDLRAAMISSTVIVFTCRTHPGRWRGALPMVMLVAHTSLELAEAGHWRIGPLHPTSNVFSVRGMRTLDDRLGDAALGGVIIRGLEYARAQRSFALRLRMAAVLKIMPANTSPPGESHVAAATVPPGHITCRTSRTRSACGMNYKTSIESAWSNVAWGTVERRHHPVGTKRDSVSIVYCKWKKNLSRESARAHER